MAKVHFIKRRIKSVKNIGQITGAMELVAASKLQRAVSATFASRIYSYSALEALSYLKAAFPEGHKFFQPNTGLPSLYIAFTSDRGLAGSYNRNVVDELGRSMQGGSGASIIMIGNRGGQLIAREHQDWNVIGLYPFWQHDPKLEDISPIAQTAMNMFLGGKIGRVVLVYTDFHSTSRQVVVAREILPISVTTHERSGAREDNEMLMEPSPQELINTIVPRFVRVQLYQASLEATASEHAARMMSMHAASQNADDLMESLRLEYNNARQAGITAELAEIAAGAQAIL